MAESHLPIASIENDFLRLDFFTTTGPRIIGLYARGANGNLLAETPDIHWPTPHGEFFLRGGHRLMTAPEDLFFMGPEDNLQMERSHNTVILKSPVDASSLEREITIRLDENRAHLSHRITWHGKDEIRFAPWAITQMRMGGMAIVPQSNADGLQPNRNLVLWPYTRIHDPRLELNDDLILLHGKVSAEACKVGTHTPLGWLACAMGDALFIKSFEVTAGDFPDQGCNVEVYVKDTCIELETLGPLKTLKHGHSVTHSETWQVLTGSYPATLETARTILRDHSNQDGA